MSCANRMRRACAVYDHTLGHLGEIPNNVVMRRFEVDAMAGTAANGSNGRSAHQAQRRLWAPRPTVDSNGTHQRSR